MTTKKYQIFVSSTFRDLAEERQDAIRNILDLNHIPAGMELFPAADVDQLKYIQKVIDECDYYIIIIGGRYGSVDSEGVSYTEKEYDYAVATQKIVLGFVHSDASLIPVGKSELNENAISALNHFREKVMTGRLVRSWNTRQDLEVAVLKALMHAFNDMPQAGWIRGSEVANDELLKENNNLRKSYDELKAKYESETAFKIDASDIAGLDDKFEIRYEYTYYSQSIRRSANDKFSATWREIFVSVAGFLDTSKTDIVFSQAFIRLLNENGISRSSVDINDVDKLRIKVHLNALGLIKSAVGKSINGPHYEYQHLTAAGRALFFNEMVVRK